ncbi:putative DNA binding domain-containing protein [Vannielia litorea]|uniref:ATP-binding protein n=1 Tax=Vannielia litorea TaxID=1217970 RepID=UPI001C985F31|nr:ATP-binding protein [Vannielia litorea]MBY6154719.1 putative DNA binding domain-containing protein [Vannielia litorea]
MISKKELVGWISTAPENENLEFKLASQNFDRKRLFGYVVALANEMGGYLILGVTDKRPRKALGTAAFQSLNDLKSDIRANTSLSVQVSEFVVDGARVIVIKAPARPRGTAYNYRGTYFMRCGEELTHMAEDRLREIFSEVSSWDTDVAEAGLSPDEVCKLLDVDALFRLLDRPMPNSEMEICDKLCELRLVERLDDSISIRNSGAIALARDLESFPRLSRKAPRLIVYNGRNKLDTKLDVTGRRGFASGFQGLVRSCMEHMPKNEIVQDALRRTVELFPERAMREVIANALIHQDFSVGGTGPLIEIYADRVEVSNPGEPVISVTRFIDGHRSRNENLAWCFRQMNICEERSSGIDRVVSTAELYQLPAPEFISSFQSTTVVIYGPRDFKQMTSDDKIRACYQHCVLRYVMREQMTNESLTARFGLDESSRATVSKILKATVDANLVALDPAVGGSRKYARYVPAWSVQPVG